MKNNDGAGATQTKSGGNRKAIDRHAGYSAVLTCLQSKTRSPHNSAGGPNYQYIGVSGYGSNENIKGYGTK